MAVVEQRGRTDGLLERLRAERAAAGRSSVGRQELAARVRRYERKYGVKSEQLHQAIDRGEIRETDEISRWLIESDLLRRVGRR